MQMTNNDILKKLRVALKLRDDDIVKILALVDFRISKRERHQNRYLKKGGTSKNTTLF